MDYKNYNDYELLSYVSEGNEEANNIIIKKYTPLINKFATKMYAYCKNNGLDKSDLIQEGMIGLSHAIDRYQEMADATFYTYAKLCIERKIISAVLSSNRNKNKILNESISFDDDENMLLKIVRDSSPNPEEIIVDSENEENIINKIKKVLTPLEEEVFSLLISGFKYKEIAQIIDKEEKSVDNTIQRIKNKIRNLDIIKNSN